MGDNTGWVRRHDQYQFEVKLAYDLHRHIRRDHYRVDTYFFLPENLDINEGTYTKTNFYRDLLLYIRFRTPDFTLSALTDAGSERSPLRGVAQRLAVCLAQGGDDQLAALDYEMRLLGCVLKNTLRQQTQSVDGLLRETHSERIPRCWEQAEALLTEFLTQTRRVASRFRALKTSFQDPRLPAATASTYAFTDEYISLLIEEQAHELLRLTQDHTHPPLARAAAELAAVIESETRFRRESGYPSFVADGSENETLVFRTSVLKKFMAGCLHLRVQKRVEDHGLEHLLLALGAGLAMLFATAVAFYYQRVYGTLSLGFFVILVVSYMFKDRMKALSQARLQHWLSKNVYDQATSIFDPLSGEKIGLCREAVGFVPEQRVDPLALRLRNRDHITEIENTWRAEKVIHYTKDITLFSPKILRRHKRKTGITDIVRFNLRNFLLKMDEPMKDLYTLRDGRSETVSGARVYHVNVVLRYSSRRETRYERLRLVLNRNGIKRIEPVGAERAPGKSHFNPFPIRPA